MLNTAQTQVVTFGVHHACTRVHTRAAETLKCFISSKEKMLTRPKKEVQNKENGRKGFSLNVYQGQRCWLEP